MIKFECWILADDNDYFVCRNGYYIGISQTDIGNCKIFKRKGTALKCLESPKTKSAIGNKIFFPKLIRIEEIEDGL